MYARAALLIRRESFFEELHSAAVKHRAALMRPIPISSKLTLRSLERVFLLQLEYQSSNGLQRVSFFLRVTIKEVFSGLMQLLTTSCFLKSESSHSLAIIS